MELDDRKRRILAVIARIYTDTGEPVGSKLIANTLNSAFSSATIRNDMAALFDMGLLEQPYTSAGRILSHSGYRVYVDDLMEEQPVSDDEQRGIEAMFNVSDPDPDKLLEDAAHALSELTKCVAFTMTITPPSVTVRRVVVIPAGHGTVVIMVIASNGVIKSKVCRVGFRLNDEVVDFFTSFAKNTITGMSLAEISQNYLGTVSVSLGEYSRLFTPLLAAVYELCSEIYAGQFYIAGSTKLLRYPEYAAAPFEIMDFLSDREKVQALTESGRQDGTTVTLGKENRQMELWNSSVLVNKYSIHNQTFGAIGIIGPIRMDYAETIAELEYFAKLMGDVLGEAFEEQ